MKRAAAVRKKRKIVIIENYVENYVENFGVYTVYNCLYLIYTAEV